MSKKTKVIAGTIGVLVVALLAGALFVRYQVRKSFPRTSGRIRIAGLEKPVRVVRDSYGTPLIRAETEHDLMMAAGFVQAQDRLWQMDIARRAGEGRLADIFGPRTLPFDRMFRIIGLRRIAEKIAAGLPPSTISRLQWYSDGVNAYIASAKGRYPIEFDLLRYEPEPWEPVHSIIIGRMMAWELNLSWWTDLTYGLISERVGLERTLDILPEGTEQAVPSVPQEEWRKYAAISPDLLLTTRQFAEFYGTDALAQGSNAWAVSSSRSITGAPILANDTHLRLQLPSHWYEMQMEWPGFRVRGMSIPGVPVIVAGRNQWIAWGLTNVMADDADFYVERVDSLKGDTYFFDGRWQPMTILHEEIPVRGDTASPVTIRLTRHGPVVTDIVTPLTRAHVPYVASMRWTAQDVDDQVDAFFQINRAHTWEEFRRGVKDYAVPGQNFVFADTEGNIGYWCGAKIPVRNSKHSILPFPGWDPMSEWKGFVPFSQLPHRYNPPDGYLASANNKLVDDSYPYHISDLWEPSSRIERLNEVLGKKGELFSVKDFERLQNDTRSHYARTIVPYIIEAFRDSVSGFPEGNSVFEYFRNWNAEFGKDDIATAIFEEFLVHCIHDIFADEMGEDIYHDWVMLTNVPMRVTEKLFRENASPWFDDITTSKTENRDDIIRKSLREAIAALQSRFGNETKNWRWGELHTVTLEHPFGLQKPFDKIFNVGPYPVSGASTALVSFEYSFNDPFAVTVAPSFRQIFDLSKEGEIHSVLPSGESGQVFHEHYHDQTELWLNGGYRVSWFSHLPEHGTHRLILEPKR
jgi:penicillin amidase